MKLKPKRPPKPGDRNVLAPALKAAFDVSDAPAQPECFDAIIRKIK